jgi:hypothetical protein
MNILTRAHPYCNTQTHTHTHILAYNTKIYAEYFTVVVTVVTDDDDEDDDDDDGASTLLSEQPLTMLTTCGPVRRRWP